MKETKINNSAFQKKKSYCLKTCQCKEHFCLIGMRTLNCGVVFVSPPSSSWSRNNCRQEYCEATRVSGSPMWEEVTPEFAPSLKLHHTSNQDKSNHMPSTSNWSNIEHKWCLKLSAAILIWHEKCLWFLFMTKSQMSLLLLIFFPTFIIF